MQRWFCYLNFVIVGVASSTALSRLISRHELLNATRNAEFYSQLAFTCLNYPLFVVWCTSIAAPRGLFVVWILYDFSTWAWFARSYLTDPERVRYSTSFFAASEVLATVVFFVLDWLNRQLHETVCKLEAARSKLDERVEQLRVSNERREYEIRMLSRLASDQTSNATLRCSTQQVPTVPLPPLLAPASRSNSNLPSIHEDEQMHDGGGACGRDLEAGPPHIPATAVVRVWGEQESCTCVTAGAIETARVGDVVDLARTRPRHSRRAKPDEEELAAGAEAGFELEAQVEVLMERMRAEYGDALDPEMIEAMRPTLRQGLMSADSGELPSHSECSGHGSGSAMSTE